MMPLKLILPLDEESRAVIMWCITGPEFCQLECPKEYWPEALQRYSSNLTSFIALIKVHVGRMMLEVEFCELALKTSLAGQCSTILPTTESLECRKVSFTFFYFLRQAWQHCTPSGLFSFSVNIDFHSEFNPDENVSDLLELCWKGSRGRWKA